MHSIATEKLISVVLKFSHKFQIICSVSLYYCQETVNFGKILFANTQILQKRSNDFKIRVIFTVYDPKLLLFCQTYKCQQHVPTTTGIYGGTFVRTRSSCYRYSLYSFRLLVEAENWSSQHSSQQRAHSGQLLAWSLELSLQINSMITGLRANLTLSFCLSGIVALGNAYLATQEL